MGKDSPVKGKVFFIGQSHIDAAWLWTLDETIHVCCKETFEKALKLMEKYPEFKFAQSTAQFYEWMEEYYPEIFAKIKEMVEKGKWEIVGGSWVECDLNLPSGESLVRQFLYGKRYFKEKFGVDVRVAWFPDCFGYPATLPMILKGCEIDYFATGKLAWNDTLRFPYNVFWWESPDGSRVLAFQAIVGLKEEDIPRALMILAFKHRLLTLMVPYGRGDHGGGPDESDIERILKIKEKADFEVVLGGVLDFFKEVERNAVFASIPTVPDELYFQFHRGTYTTQAKIKELNRRCEIALEALEKLASLLYALGHEYPQKEIYNLWKVVLLNQFHDIICGSSIEEVCEESVEQLSGVLRKISEIMAKCVGELAAKHVNAGGCTSDTVLVFTHVPWPMKTIVTIPVASREGVQGKNFVLKDSEGRVYPAQVVEEDGEKQLLAIADLPGIGYKVFEVAEAEHAPITDLRISEDDSKIVLENRFLRVTVSKDSGRIVSVYDKRAGREVLGKRGVRIEVYDDTPVPGRVTLGSDLRWGMGADAIGMDAWEIFAFQQPFSVSYTALSEPIEVKVVEKGPIRATVLVKYIYKQKDRPDSVFEHYIQLYSNLPYVVGKIVVEWRALHRMAKLAIDVDFYSEKPVYEIPYGVIERRNIASPYASLFDRAKWEVPAQRWLDYYSEEEDYGLALINFARYGFDIVNKTIRMTLLRAAKHPPRYGTRTPGTPTDQGRHVVTYLLYPHRGDWREAKVYKVAYLHNSKIVTTRGNVCGKGELEPEFTFVAAEPDNIAITVVKKAEDDKALVIRLHEVEGKECRARVRISFKVEKAVECNLLEKPLRELPIADALMGKGSVIEIDVKPYQLKTVKVYLKAKK